MKEKEGVIKYQFKHTTLPLPENIDFSKLNSWRSIMLKLKMIGQDPLRYDGLGFGNISQRLSKSSQSFIISGTQTGHLDPLSKNDLCIIQSADIQTNTITSEGPCNPSSEALTHASVYLKALGAQCIIHGHCPAIWQHTKRLQLAYTDQKIAYGTPEMAEAVAQVIQSYGSASAGIFSMLGHKDGVVAFAPDFEQAAGYLIINFAQALAIEQASFFI